MSFAPLDAWLRMLSAPGAAVEPRYWLRLATALVCSAFATVLTLPERVATAVLLHRRGARADDEGRAPLFVLGYFRSGTTHLQYLLDCDPNLFSPKWFHAFVPEGFIFSWAVLRLLMTAFMPAVRPIDASEFGPEMPAEDDFGLSNWTAASALPGWSIVPRAYAFFRRFHALQELAPAERARWCRYQVAFARKLSVLARGRRLLLKSPSHTARVETLLELFPGARFVHISRDPGEVVRSNLKMRRVMQERYGLQEPLSAAESERDIVGEYLEVERRYLRSRGRIPRGRLSEVRFEDLIADPMGELRRIYRELELNFSRAFEERLIVYLDAARSYRPNPNPALTAEQRARLMPLLAPLKEEFGQDRPPIARVAPPPPAVPAAAMRRRAGRRAVVVGTITAIICAVVWLTVAEAAGNNLDSLVWPAGLAIGYAVNRTAGRGSSFLGIWAALLTAAVLITVAFSTSRAIDYAGRENVHAAELWAATFSRLGTNAHMFWSLFGFTSAWRLASPTQV